MADHEGHQRHIVIGGLLATGKWFGCNVLQFCAAICLQKLIDDCGSAEPLCFRDFVQRVLQARWNVKVDQLMCHRVPFVVLRGIGFANVEFLEDQVLCMFAVPVGLWASPIFTGIFRAYRLLHLKKVPLGYNKD